jgi:hypothetical protein
MRKIATIITLATAFALGGCGMVVQSIEQRNREKKLAEIKMPVLS